MPSINEIRDYINVNVHPNNINKVVPLLKGVSAVIVSVSIPVFFRYSFRTSLILSSCLIAIGGALCVVALRLLQNVGPKQLFADLEKILNVQSNNTSLFIDNTTQKYKDKFFPRKNEIKCIKHTALPPDPVTGISLHANLIKSGLSEKQFIASQAPLKEEFETFWRAVPNRGVILDLSLPEDNIDPYYPFPMVGKYLWFGTATVKVTRVANLNDVEYEVLIKDGVAKTIRRINTSWKTPEEFESLISFLEPLENVWILCPHGVGRTGSLIAGYYLLNIKDSMKFFEKTLKTLVLALRDQRHSFVENEEQFTLLYEYAKNKGMIEELLKPRSEPDLGTYLLKQREEKKSKSKWGF